MSLSNTVDPAKRTNPTVEPLASDIVEPMDEDFILSMKRLRLREPLGGEEKQAAQPSERPATHAAPKSKSTSKRNMHNRPPQSRLMTAQLRKPAVGASDEERRHPHGPASRGSHELAAEPGTTLTKLAPAERRRQIDEMDPYQ